MRRGEQLEGVRRDLGMELADLWLNYVTIGGSETPATMEQYLLGEPALDFLQHDRLAQALNDRALELDADHPAPYREDVGGDPPTSR